QVDAGRLELVGLELRGRDDLVRPHQVPQALVRDDAGSVLVAGRVFHREEPGCLAAIGHVMPVRPTAPLLSLGEIRAVNTGAGGRCKRSSTHISSTPCPPARTAAG